MNALSGLIQGCNMLEGQLVHLLEYPPGVVVNVVRYFILNFQNSKCLQSYKDDIMSWKV